MTDDGTAAAFVRAHGRAPEALWRAPGRVNLIGEHTDYNDGFVLPLALGLEVRVAAAARTDGRLRVASAQPGYAPTDVALADLRPGAVDGWSAYAAGTAWSLLVDGVPFTGADLLVDGDLPAGAGLSSSAALECATAGALLELAGVTLPADRVARLAQRAENEFVGVPCGVMDQAASTQARAGHALLLDTRSSVVEHLPLDLGGAGLTLLCIDTRAPHRLVDGEYAARRADCERAARLLGVAALRDVDDLDRALGSLPDPVLRRRVRHVVTENGRVLEVAARLREGDVRGIGAALTASHVSLRDDYEVSSRELDLAVEAALEAGAYGSRMTGGGFGGSALALVETASVEGVRRRVREAYAAARLTEPGFLEATPAAGFGPVA